MPEVWIVTLDLVGIAVFACTGAIVAVRKELDVFGAAVLGLVTGLGGGVLRDVLAGRVPVIFREELYATPAFAGALLAVLAHGAGLGWWAYVGAGALCVGWRLLALWRGWRAPLPPGLQQG